MVTRLAEALRKWAGWCPNQGVSASFQRTNRYADSHSPAPPDNDAQVLSGVIVDYGGWISTPSLVIALAAGFVVLVLYLSVMYPPAGGFLFLTLCLAYSGMELYTTLRRDRIEVAGDCIVFRRSLLPSVTIPKDTVVKAEVRENKPPMPFWLLAAAIVLILASAVGSIYRGLDNPASFRVICGFGAAVFFPVMFYRTCIRTRYPQVLALTTAQKKIAMIYADDPDSIAGILEVS